MKSIKDYPGKYTYFIVLSIFTAAGNMGVIYMVNQIINNYFSGTPVVQFKYLLYFTLCLLLFFTCRWLVSLGIVRFTQKLLRETRLEVLRMVIRSTFESLGRNKERIFMSLTRDVDIVVNASINVVDIVTNAVVILICLIYMATLSWKLLLCMLGLIAFTLLIYFLSEKRARQLFKAAFVFNEQFVKYLNEILGGFKEITMERKKGFEILDSHIDGSVRQASGLYQKAQVNFLTNRIIGQMAFYIFIGLLLLFLGDLFNISKGVTVNFIFLILYIWSPIETVVLLIPNFSQAGVSVKRLAELESRIMVDKAADIRFPGRAVFTKLELNDISYKYASAKKEQEDAEFGIGPLDFILEKGDVVFISGGNGSGKTTFMNVLTGIFKNAEGQISVDGERIPDPQSYDYQSLFAPVFQDFHLFDQCYGIENIDVEKANEYLRLFGIDNKVTFDGNRFASINLSAGQRKRLALICSMLEKKPVLVLDEFAADQDPDFKRRFYTQIIPYLKMQEFTLVAITHDDNYYQYADKLYKMDSGRLNEVMLETQTQTI